MVKIYPLSLFSCKYHLSSVNVNYKNLVFLYAFSYAHLKKQGIVVVELVIRNNRFCSFRTHSDETVHGPVKRLHHEHQF
jgi:hypothetical protein